MPTSQHTDPAGARVIQVFESMRQSCPHYRKAREWTDAACRHRGNDGMGSSCSVGCCPRLAALAGEAW